MIDLKENWTPTQAEFDAFAALSGDDNAIHTDPAFCAETTFGRTVSHGMLLYTKLWGMIKRHDASLSQSHQSMMFPNPAYSGETLTLHIVEDRPGHVHMRVARLADGADCLIGEADFSC